MKREIGYSFGGLLGAILGGAAPKIALTQVGELEVSTVNSLDCGPETAICDEDGAVYPVERYADVDAAEAGHKKWVQAAKTLKTVHQLGYGDLVEAEDVTLKGDGSAGVPVV